LVYLISVCSFSIAGGLVGCTNPLPSGINGINISDRSGNIVNIDELHQNPSGVRTIYLQGEVANRAPFLAGGAYELQDATGTIWVIANQTLPEIGDKVTVRGQVQFQSIPLGGRDLGEVYVQEEAQLERQPGQPVESPVVPQES
jgi:hypothetical protein